MSNKKRSGTGENLANKATNCPKSSHVLRYLLKKNLYLMSMKLVMSVLQQDHEIQSMLTCSLERKIKAMEGKNLGDQDNSVTIYATELIVFDN